MCQRAWAVWDSKIGQILITTVSDTQNAARVNWLYAYAGVVVYEGAAEADIQTIFDELSPEAAVRLIPVDVKAAPDAKVLQ